MINEPMGGPVPSPMAPATLAGTFDDAASPAGGAAAGFTPAENASIDRVIQIIPCPVPPHGSSAKEEAYFPNLRLALGSLS